MDIFGAGDLYYVSLKNNISNNAILGFLNSSLVLYHLKKRGKRKGETIEYYKSPLERIPVHKLIIEDGSVVKSLENIVSDIIRNKRDDPDYNSDSEERKIDQIVYKLYNLSSKDIEVIENSRS